MLIDEKLLKRLEKLSSLALDDKTRENLISDFDDILKFVDNLNEVDTSNLELNNSDYTPLREDIVVKSDIIDDVLEYAPTKLDKFFTVPKIIE